jgi:hypothetical protein
MSFIRVTANKTRIPESRHFAKLNVRCSSAAQSELQKLGCGRTYSIASAGI